MFDYPDKFLTIRPYPNVNGLYISWLTASRAMSRLDFKWSVELLLNTITLVQPNVILIDAFEYNYPVIPEETVRLIRRALACSNVRSYGLIKSNHRFGQIVINGFLRQITGYQQSIILFDSKMKGLRWFLGNKS